MFTVEPLAAPFHEGVAGNALVVPVPWHIRQRPLYEVSWAAVWVVMAVGVVGRGPPAGVLLEATVVELVGARVVEVVAWVEVVADLEVVGAGATVVAGALLVFVDLVPPQPATTKTILISETMAIDDLVFIRFISFY